MTPPQKSSVTLSTKFNQADSAKKAHAAEKCVDLNLLGNLQDGVGIRLLPQRKERGVTCGGCD
jgi:hypothetical protein